MQPLVIAGMHRSNTSLVAKAFAAAGINLGDKLMEGSPSNPEGYFEDIDIVGLEDQLLQIQNKKHGTWHVFDRKDFEHEIAEKWYSRARTLVDEKINQFPSFGWKSPRSVLFLDFWKKVYPEAKFVFIFRHPALVLKSLLKRGDMKRFSRLWPIQVKRCLQVWMVYNQALIDFYKSYPEDCFLMEAPQSFADDNLINDLNQTMQNQWNYEVNHLEFTKVVNPKLLKTDAGKLNNWIVSQSSGIVKLHKELRFLTQSVNV